MVSRANESGATRRSTGAYAKGALCSLAAVSIWAGWIVVARMGLRTSLAPADITAIRFAVAGLIFLPWLLRHGWAFDKLGWTGIVLLAVGGGAPIVLLEHIPFGWNQPNGMCPV